MAATAAATSEHDALDDAWAKRWRLIWAGAALVGLGLAAVSSVPLAITAQTVCGELLCANSQLKPTAAVWLVDHRIAVSTWVMVLLALRWMIMLAMVARAPGFCGPDRGAGSRSFWRCWVSPPALRAFWQSGSPRP